MSSRPAIPHDQLRRDRQRNRSRQRIQQRGQELDRPCQRSSPRPRSAPALDRRRNRSPPHTSHRLRVADLFGDGHPVVVNAGLTGARATAPDYRDQTPLVYYRPGEWKRHTISTENSGVVLDGHTIQTADFNHDGNDEIVAGFRGQPHSVYLYAYDAAAKRWTRSDLDQGGMGAASCAIADLNGDGRPDVACIDSSRLKWYENR